MRFAYYWYLTLIIIIPFLIWRYIYWKGTAPLKYSDIGRVKKAFGVANSRPPATHTLRHLLFGLRLVVLTLFILSIARPQAEIVSSEIYTEGVDIVLTVDVSGSMDFIDLDVQNKRTRLEVTKEAVKTFVNGRQNDRIGMLVFASEAFLQCPLTVDYGIVKNFLDDVRIGMIDERSTAIGNAIASALNRLRYTEAKSKVVVLITDGANNAGQIDPFTAAEMAKALDVKIYTIGVGGRGTPFMIKKGIFGKTMVPYPDAEKVDEYSLTRIAEITNGKYFRATDTEGFYKIFEEIDELEKTKIRSEAHRRFRELFPYTLIPALVLLLIEVILSQTRFRKLP